MKLIKRVVAGGATAAMLVSVAACGSSGGNSSEGTADNPVTINVWAWEPTLTNVKEAFEKQYPNIKVKITNAGTAGKEYTALQNALTAGRGAPDLAQIEYFAIPQFSLADSLYDLTKFGADKFSDYYNPGPWSAVSSNGGVWALPMDSGPTSFFYNKDVFDNAGVTEAPKTWNEFYEAAKKVRAVGSYILTEPTNIAVTESWIWAAGGKPVKVDGENVTINYAGDSKAKAFSEYMQKLIDEDLINTKLSMWSDDWYKALGDGSLCGITTGAWMVAMLKSGVPDTSGQWRIADMPQYNADDFGNGEDGGSSLAMLADTDKADAAYKFLEFATHDREGVDTRIDLGQFPADAQTLEDPDFASKTDEFFGDQKYQDVLIKAARKVRSGWSYLPYEVYARNNFGDFTGKAASDKSITYQQGMEQWQADLVQYGNDQGFTVNK